MLYTHLPLPITAPPFCRRVRTISLCLRVRLRLLTAGLLLLRAAGGTAEEAAASAAAAKEGGSVGVGGNGGGFGGSSSTPAGGGRSYNTRCSSSSGAGVEESQEGSARLSRQARLKLLRRACGTLRELDALEESLNARQRRSSGGSGGSRRGKRGPGASLGDGDGGLEAEEDHAVRAHIVETCVSIIEEMFIPRAYMAAGGGAEGAEWPSEGEGGLGGGGIGPMGPEVERIVREEKVRTVVHPCYMPAVLSLLIV